MNVLVTGGTGALGRHIVEALLEQTNATVRVMTRTVPQTEPLPRTEWVEADLGSGVGLKKAVQNIDLIIHAASDYLLNPEKVDVEGTRLLLQQAKEAAVSHLAYVSIVGIERIPLFLLPLQAGCGRVD